MYRFRAVINRDSVLALLVTSAFLRQSAAHCREVQVRMGLVFSIRFRVPTYPLRRTA